MTRKGSASRRTAETDVSVEICLDGVGDARISVENDFLRHMLSAFAFHGRFDLRLEASATLDLGGHHLVEDVGLCLGKAIREALRSGEGLERFGWAVIPMDEALVCASVDVSGRGSAHLCVVSGRDAGVPGTWWTGDGSIADGGGARVADPLYDPSWSRATPALEPASGGVTATVPEGRPRSGGGAFERGLVEEFLKALSREAGITLHLLVLRPGNPHHTVEAGFKALGRALKAAVAPSGKGGAPSTKGVLF